MWKKPIVWIPVVLAAALTLTALPWSDKAQADVTLKAPRAVQWNDFLGVDAQFQYFDPAVYQKQMAALDTLGLSWVRLSIHWAVIEPTEGKIDFTALDGAMSAMAAHKYNIVAYLVGSAPFATSAPAGAAAQDQYPPKDVSVFANRMVTLAKRYPQVNTWQPWNEPNITWRPVPDSAAYGQLLLASTTALRAAVPTTNVGTAGMAYYSQNPANGSLMLADLLQGLAANKLIVSYHPYSQYPEGDDPAAKDFIQRGNLVNTTLHNNGVSQVWATEWGWSSYAGPVELQPIIGVNGQADYTLRRLALMSAMDYQRIFLFNLTDLDARASARDQFYGLVDLNGDPKPVYTALKNLFDVTGSRIEPADAPAYTNSPGDLYNVAWTRADGSHLWMFWSASGSSVTLPSVTSATLIDPLNGARTTLANDKGISVPLKTSLQLLIW
ncbi:beta-galactosidase [Pseudomonas putida]